MKMPREERLATMCRAVSLANVTTCQYLALNTLAHVAKCFHLSLKRLAERTAQQAQLTAAGQWFAATGDDALLTPKPQTWLCGSAGPGGDGGAAGLLCPPSLLLWPKRPLAQPVQPYLGP